MARAPWWRQEGRSATGERDPAAGHRAGAAPLRARGPPRTAPPACRAARGRRRRAVIEFDSLKVDVGYDSLLVRGELLISQQSFAQAEPYLASLGLVRAEFDHRRLRTEQLATAQLAERVVVLTPQDHGGMPIPIERPATGRHRQEPQAPGLLRGGDAGLRDRSGDQGTGWPAPGPAAAGAAASSPAVARRWPSSTPASHQQRSGTVLPGSTLDDLHQFPLGTARRRLPSGTSTSAWTPATARSSPASSSRSHPAPRSPSTGPWTATASAAM